MGPSIKYVTLFWTNFDPLPYHTLSHISGPPKVRHTFRNPKFLVVHAYIHVGYILCLYREDCLSSRGFLSGGFGPGFFFVWKVLFGVVLSVPSLATSIRKHLLQKKAKHHFQF